MAVCEQGRSGGGLDGHPLVFATSYKTKSCISLAGIVGKQTYLMEANNTCMLKIGSLRALLIRPLYILALCDVSITSSTSQYAIQSPHCALIWQPMSNTSTNTPSHVNISKMSISPNPLTRASNPLHPTPSPQTPPKVHTMPSTNPSTNESKPEKQRPRIALDAVRRMIWHGIGHKTRDKQVQAEAIKAPETLSIGGSIEALSVHDTSETISGEVWRSPEEEKEAVGAWHSECW